MRGLPQEHQYDRHLPAKSVYTYCPPAHADQCSAEDVLHRHSTETAHHTSHSRHNEYAVAIGSSL